LAAEAVPLLRIDDVHVYYGLSHVLQGVSLGARDGAVTAVVGRNGAGKTTLVNAIMGMAPVARGKIAVAGEEIQGKRIDQRRGLGMALAPQGRRVFRSLTVAEHLGLVAESKGGLFDRERLYAIFPRLKERERSLASTLSGGEQSMLAIARALTTNPRLLLMDEPTEGLAPLLIETVGDVIRRIREAGVTVLLVEQNLSFALDVADSVAVMERGLIDFVRPRAEITDVAALSKLIVEGAGA
jgi:branched-chain amino acid transport system ATP-binding protein